MKKIVNKSSPKQDAQNKYVRKPNGEVNSYDYYLVLAFIIFFYPYSERAIKKTNYSRRRSIINELNQAIRRGRE